MRGQRLSSQPRSRVGSTCFEPALEVHMTSPQQTGHRHAGGRTQDAVRRARFHLTAASSMLDSAATAITRATELADERDGVGDELADDLAALRSSARMLVDVLSASEGPAAATPD